ncbi:hypothetical protein ACA910_004160 [Epithemia clementina (nom. ined.)]
MQVPKRRPDSPSPSIGGSKFAQPAFSSLSSLRKPRAKNSLETKTNSNPVNLRNNTKSNQKMVFGGDSTIASRHKERLKNAGREGTKRYQNPNKVFLGNLNFNITSKDLEDWLSEQLGVPAPLLLKQCKVVQDWQTQISKGYGFAVFSEPIYATVCLEKCHGMMVAGRTLTVSPGFKKMPDPAIYLEKKRQKAKDREEAAIQAGIMDASSSSPPVKSEGMDPMDARMLRKLDPDLVVDANDEVTLTENQAYVEVEDDDDDCEEEELLDDDDDEVDGLWEDENDPNDDRNDNDAPRGNRQRRREASRKKKKRSMSNKGFGQVS